MNKNNSKSATNLTVSDNTSSSNSPFSAQTTIATSSPNSSKATTSSNISQLSTNESSRNDSDDNDNNQQNSSIPDISIKIFKKIVPNSKIDSQTIGKELENNQRKDSEIINNQSLSYQTSTMDNNDFHLDIENENDLTNLILEFKKIVMEKNNDQDFGNPKGSNIFIEENIKNDNDKNNNEINENVVSKIVSFKSVNYLQSFINLIESKDINYEFIDKSLDKSLILPGNLYIRGLDKNTTSEQLYEIFSKFGKIDSCKIIYDNNGNSKGFGFLNYTNQKMAQDAIDNLNGTKIGENLLFVNHHISKKERLGKLEFDRSFFTTLYISNLPPWFTEDKLFEIFGKFGKINSIFIPNLEEEQSEKEIQTTQENEEIEITEQNETDVTDSKDKIKEKEKEQEIDQNPSVENIVATLDTEHENDTIKIISEDNNDETAVSDTEIDIDNDNDDEKTEQPKLHRGYGFVSFRRHSDAVRAMNEMANFEIASGFKLVINRAERRQEKYQYQHLNDSFKHSKSLSAFNKNQPKRNVGGSKNPTSQYDYPTMALPLPRSQQQQQQPPQLSYQGGILPTALNAPMPSQFQQHSMNSGINQNQNMQSQQGSMGPHPPPPPPPPFFNFNPYFYSGPPQSYSSNDLQFSHPQFSPNDFRNSGGDLNSVQLSSGSSSEMNLLYQDDHSSSHGSMSVGMGALSRGNSLNSVSNQSIGYSDLDRPPQLPILPVAGPKFQDTNLYITGIPLNFKDKDLHDLFSKYGSIVSARIMTSQPPEVNLVEEEENSKKKTNDQSNDTPADNGKKSKGFGFVCFQSPIDTARALFEMNNYKIFRPKSSDSEGKVDTKEEDKYDVLHVSFAQRKENRIGKNGDIHHYQQNQSLQYNNQLFVDSLNKSNQQRNLRAMSDNQLLGYYSNQQQQSQQPQQQQQQPQQSQQQAQQQQQQQQAQQQQQTQQQQQVQQAQQQQYSMDSSGNPNFYSYNRRHTVGPGTPFYYGSPQGFYPYNSGNNNMNNNQNYYHDPHYQDPSHYHGGPVYPGDYNRSSR